jgi:hypothetical protein
MLCQKLAENLEDAIEPETQVEAMTNLNVPNAASHRKRIKRLKLTKKWQAANVIRYTRGLPFLFLTPMRYLKIKAAAKSVRLLLLR